LISESCFFSALARWRQAALSMWGHPHLAVRWSERPQRARRINGRRLAIILSVASALHAQQIPPVHLTAERDHQRIMELLHIKLLRRGPDGDPKSPNAANVDESKVRSYVLPDPLQLNDGKQITTAAQWWTERRPQIVEDFDREVYGRVPVHTPKVTWEIKSTKREMAGDVPVLTKELIGHVDNSAYPAVRVDIQLTLSTPANAKGPVPVVLEFSLSPEVLAGLVKRFPQLQPTGPTWQQQLAAKGWGSANLIATSIQADNGENLTQGIIGLTNHGQPRKLDDWGALRAWAWGASRALDYFETDKDVDAKHVGIEGLSRYGKAALVTMAYDPRFAIGFIASSGAGGAKILRRNFGEQVENLASSSEYHWFAGNFLKYAGPLTVDDLPVDAHELIALCAPRPVFISSGSQQVEGGWVDAKGMFLGAVGAGPVYRLLGKKDLGTTELPPIETVLISGELAFRQHTDGHTAGPNWPTFLTFASRYFPSEETAKGMSAEESPPSDAASLHLTSDDVLETHGLSILLFHNSYHPVFGDQKMSGMEIILHDQRIATNGDVRLSPTPAQWDPIPEFHERTHGPDPNSIDASCTYPKHNLSYHIELRPEAGGLRASVQLDYPLPADLVGKAGFNLEFLPTAYFGKSYILDDGGGIFSRHPDGPMQKTNGPVEPLPLATGRSIVLSPEDPLTRVSISSDDGPLMLFDGRNQAQNGWFVVRTLIPADKTKDVIVWHIHANVIPDWRRIPVVGYNQVGYTPDRTKIAVIELDPLFEPPRTARVLRLLPSGEYKEAFSGEVKPWGKWMRYNYAHFDFSAVREPGIYIIEFAGRRTGPFRIAKNIYDGIWQPSLETYLAVQMDHVKVREAYRIWHGVSHLDDARQAPVNYTHFDGYAQGPTTDSPFSPGQHIPGLNSGGWYDAGDYDLRTQTQAQVITDLVLSFERFGLNADDTTVDEKARYVEMRKPDGIPDAIQQIEHGVILLLAQYRIFGHAIPGIIEPTLEEYTHLGDAASQTDGRIYSAKLGRLETDGNYSGVPDDRWAFTTHTTPLNYDAIASLAAASRVLGPYNSGMAAECLQVAERVWQEEHQRPPTLFHSFNTTGTDLEIGETRAAVELLLATEGGEIYRKRLTELLPVIDERFAFLGGLAVRAMPFMNVDFKNALASSVRAFKTKLDTTLTQNPYGVPISTGTWGGSGQVAGFAVNMYFLHEAFPDLIEPDYTLRGLDYLLGTHPVSNVSLVSTVGTNSKLIGYGNNRADYTFIPGGMVPGVTILKPDFPELTNSWPFFWYENEYVVDAATAFILTASAANALVH
jgi:endoglucanase